MKNHLTACITAMTLFAALANAVRLGAQEQESQSAITGTPNPVPLINQPLVPDAAKPGGAGFKLTVNGTGFLSGSVVKWNGSARATTFVSHSRLTVSILSSDIAKPTTASVTVVNPGPGGGASNPGFFEVTTPTPAIALNISKYGAGSGSQSVATGDFNGDGKLDLVVANLYSSTVTVLLGNGDGTFKPRVDYATGLNPTSVAVGDFNGDGRADLVVASAGDSTVNVLLGNGDGTFRAKVDYGTGLNPSSVTVGDFNGDGKLDLVVANVNGNTVSALLGNGDGTFQTHVDYGTGSSPVLVAVGDFNGDGKLDLAVANSVGTVSVLLGNGDGSFGPHVDYVIGGFSFSVAVGDFNGDGKLDLAVTNSNSAVGVFLGNGDGTFQARVDYGAGSFPFSVAVGDFNGDNKLDLAVANSGSNNVSVLLGKGDGTFQAAVDYAAGTGPVSLAVGDFNRDGSFDLAASGDGVSVLLQSPTVSLSKKSLTFADQLVGTSSTTQTVTLTNTGYLTLKIANLGITGTNATDFSQTNTCGSSLPVRASCTIIVTCKPTQIGRRTASLTISDNGVGSPHSVALSGSGVTSGPNATLSRTILTFPTQLVSTTSPGESVTLSNYGTMPLTITITASGDFSQTNNCGSSLAAGASCPISVTFKPTQRGTRAGTLSITDNAPGSPQTVSLNGTGTVVKLYPTSLSFVCTSSGFCDPHHGGCGAGPQTTTLTNTGSTTLSISSITITGATARNFFQTNNCDGNLGAGKSCTITVSFATVLGDFCGVYTDAISVSDDGGGSPQTVSLTGTVKR